MRKLSSFICEITGGKYKKLVTDEKLHVSLMTDEKRVEIEQVSLNGRTGRFRHSVWQWESFYVRKRCQSTMSAFVRYDEERMLLDTQMVERT